MDLTALRMTKKTRLTTIKLKDMQRFNLNQRFEILKTHFEYGCVIAEAVRNWRTTFVRNKVP